MRAASSAHSCESPTKYLKKTRGQTISASSAFAAAAKEIAKRIAQNIKQIEGVELPFGDLDISFYRDDLTRISDSPIVKQLELPFSIVGKKVILTDDVLYTGRTVRAAIEAVFSLGRPKAIELAVLIDRGHRELPIRADFVGKSIPTSNDETIKVMLPPFDEMTAVMILEKEKIAKV